MASVTSTPTSSIKRNGPIGQPKSYIRVVKTPLYGPDGKIVGLQGIFWDITPQYLAEERIKKATALLAQSRKRISESRGGAVMTGYNLRFLPSLVAARRHPRRSPTCP